MPTKNKIIPDKTPIAPVILITRPMMISLSAILLVSDSRFGNTLKPRAVNQSHSIMQASPCCPRQAASSGSSFVLDCANDRREYGAASASSDRLRDDAADAQITRLRCGGDRRQQ